MEEFDFDKLKERALKSMKAYEELYNHLVDLQAINDFDATDLMMITSHLSAKVINTIKKNCEKEVEKKKVAEAFLDLLKTLLMDEEQIEDTDRLSTN